MQLSDICVGLELAKQLRDAGYPQESLFYWEIHESLEEKGDFSGARLVTHIYPKSVAYAMNTYAAPTASELGEQIKGHVLPYWNHGTGWQIKQLKGEYHRCNSEADARAKLWLTLKHQGLLSTKEEK